MTHLEIVSHFPEIVLVSINRQDPPGSVEASAFWQFTLAHIKKWRSKTLLVRLTLVMKKSHCIGEMKASVGNRSVKWSIINNSTALKNIDDKLELDNLR